MPRTPTPLPKPLRSTPFAVRAALDSWVGEGRLRSRDLTRPTYGVRAHSNADDSVLARARAFAIGLPQDIAFSHVTACRLLGLPTPRPWRAREPLDITRHTDRPRIDRAGVRWHRGLERREVLVVDGLRVTDPVDTWADVAASFDLDDLVALGDGLIAADDGVRLAELRHIGLDRTGRGVRRMRDASALVRHGTRSA